MDNTDINNADLDKATRINEYETASATGMDLFYLYIFRIKS